MSNPTADHRSGAVQADLRRLVPTIRWATVVVAGRPRMLALFVAAGVAPVMVVAGVVGGRGEPVLPKRGDTEVRQPVGSRPIAVDGPGGGHRLRLPEFLDAEYLVAPMQFDGLPDHAGVE